MEKKCFTWFRIVTKIIFLMRQHERHERWRRYYLVRVRTEFHASLLQNFHLPTYTCFSENWDLGIRGKKKSKLGKVIKRPKMREIYDLQSTQFRLLLKWLCHKNRLTSFSSPVNASLWICHHIEIPPQFHHLPSHYQPHSLLTSPRCHLSLQFSNFQQFAKVSETGNCVLKRRGDRV